MKTSYAERRIIFPQALIDQIDAFCLEFRKQFDIELNRAQMAQKIMAAGVKQLNFEREIARGEASE